MTVIDDGYSYDFQNLVRDLSEVFDRLVASYPTFLSLIPRGVPAINTKMEWLEDEVAPKSSAITAFDTDGDGTGISLASTAGMRAGTILRFTSATGASETELVKVSSVDSATDITVVRDYGGSTGVTLLVGDIAHIVSSPQAESTEATAEDGYEPDSEYNYMEIFERTAEVSGTAQAVKIYGMGNAIDYQVKFALLNVMWHMNNASIYGRRVARSGSENGTMGGVLQYLTGGNVDSAGGAISATKINAILEDIFQDGGFSNNFALLCAENQARKISAFNTAGSNPVVMKEQGDSRFGGYISTFIGDLPVQQGFMAKVVVDPNFPKDQVAVLDMNRVALRPLNGRQVKDFDATTPGFDGIKRRVLGEYSLEVKNGQTAHGLITGLDL